MTSPDPIPLHSAPYPVLPEGPVPDENLNAWNRHARRENARTAVAEVHNAVEELHETQHQAYLAAQRRLVEALQADALGAQARAEVAGPPTVVEHLGPVSEDVPDTEPLDASLAARAAAVFRRDPGVPRDVLQEMLGCNSYQAKKLWEKKSTEPS